MRKYIISLTIAVAAALAAYYLLRTLPPLDAQAVRTIVESERIFSEEELLNAIDRLGSMGVLVPYLNWRNVILILTMLGTAIAAGFTFMHLLVNRLMIARFYEQVRPLVAVRRGAFLGFTVVSLILLRLYAADWYLFLVIPLFMLLAEMLLTQIFPPPVHAPAETIGPIRRDATQQYDLDEDHWQAYYEAVEHPGEIVDIAPIADVTNTGTSQEGINTSGTEELSATISHESETDSSTT
jgi:hypothetical protein